MTSRSKQIENCLVAIDMVKSLPARAFTHDLQTWSCGSAACLGGWIALHPYFRKQGVKRDETDGSPYGGDTYSNHRWSTEISEDLFGESKLFYARDTWSWPQADRVGNSKQIALNRLRITLNKLLAEA